MDETTERSWTGDPGMAASLGITHEWMRSITDYRRGPDTHTLSDGVGNMGASMVCVTPGDDSVELAFMERDCPPLVCRLLPHHVRGLARSVHRALATEAPERGRYDRREDRWAGVRASAVRPRDGSVILEARFDSAGQRVWLPDAEADRLVRLLGRH